MLVLRIVDSKHPKAIPHGLALEIAHGMISEVKGEIKSALGSGDLSENDAEAYAALFENRFSKFNDEQGPYQATFETIHDGRETYAVGVSFTFRSLN